MSFLDLDEWLIDLAEQVEHRLHARSIDVKEYPEGVDVVLVEGAVANEEDLEKIRRVRERTRMLVSFGDCAVTGNVPRCATRSAPSRCSAAPTWRTAT